MRIIAGRLGGRIFDSPHGHRTHPMSDKARGGLFNALGDIEGLTVLDAFAGSGALAYEAISRGAEEALAIETDKKAVDVIVSNIKRLSLHQHLKPIQANVSGWSDHNPSRQFDIVIADPPYDDLQQSILTKITRHVASEGLFVLSWPGNQAAPDFEGMQSQKTKSYGDIQLVFYRRIS